jgi:hypothetical protein
MKIMSQREESKVEGSLPVQARVNVMSLANLDLYWASEGYQIRTMSQLIGFSIGLLDEILAANGKLRQRANSIVEANQYLEDRGLHQRSMQRRGYKKLGMAIAFEGMREEGMDPGTYAPRVYDRLHRGLDHNGNPGTVQAFMGRVDSETARRGVEIMNNLPETNHSLLDELKGIPARDESVLVEGTSPEEMARRIAADDKAQEEALNNLDINELMKGAKKIDADTPLSHRLNYDDIKEKMEDYENRESKKIDELNEFDPLSLLNCAKKEEKSV